MPKKFTVSDIATIKSLLASADLDAHIRSYSGRCMYGKTCFAIDGKFDMFQLGLVIGENSDIAEKFANVENCTDSMGLGSVIYWPCIEAPPEHGDDGTGRCLVCGRSEDECDGGDDCE